MDILKQFHEQGITSKKLGERLKYTSFLERMKNDQNKVEKVRYTYPDSLRRS